MVLCVQVQVSHHTRDFYIFFKDSIYLNKYLIFRLLLECKTFFNDFQLNQIFCAYFEKYLEVTRLGVLVGPFLGYAHALTKSATFKSSGKRCGMSKQNGPSFFFEACLGDDEYRSSQEQGSFAS